MNAPDVRETFQRFLPQAWGDSGIVRRVPIRRPGRSPLLTSVKVAVVIAAGVAGATDFSAVQARTTAAWETPAKAGAPREYATHDWGAVIDLIDRRPILAESDEPEMLF